MGIGLSTFMCLRASRLNLFIHTIALGFPSSENQRTASADESPSVSSNASDDELIAESSADVSDAEEFGVEADSLSTKESEDVPMADIVEEVDVTPSTSAPCANVQHASDDAATSEAQNCNGEVRRKRGRPRKSESIDIEGWHSNSYVFRFTMTHKALI